MKGHGQLWQNARRVTIPFKQRNIINVRKTSKKEIMLKYKPLKTSQIVGQITKAIFNFVLLFRKAFQHVFLVKLMKADYCNLLISIAIKMTEIT